jgi:pentatricopeptide repeat protein
MNEMLTNHHFLVGNYSEAAEEIENMLKYRKDNKLIKKLIVCYTQLGKIDEAFSLFHTLVKEDINLIINTGLNEEYCPCPEIIPKVERKEVTFKNICDRDIVLGMLWLYCDPKTSLKYFSNVLNSFGYDNRINEVIKIIKSQINDH